MKLALLLVLVCSVFALDNGLGKTPPMGWNSWNKFACNINEKLIKDTARELVSSGLKDAGYTYLNLDDCWQIGRNSSGYIYPDPAVFPSGIAALSEYVHSQGLKFGLYSDAGFLTCEKRPGSLGYESQDAEMYALWKIDYLKYDNCNTDGSAPATRYPPMRDALNATGHPIFFSMCEWGIDEPATWAPKVGNSWRTTGDIRDNWASVLDILDSQIGLARYSGPGQWNDPDMLEVGNGGLTTAEDLSHFVLWAALKSPLLIGCDVTTMSKDTFDILTAPEIVAVNQDSLGAQADLIHEKMGAGGTVDHQVWAGPLADGSRVAVLFNRASTASEISVSFESLGIQGEASVRDLWLRKDQGTLTGSFSATVDSHAVVVVRVTPTTNGLASNNWLPSPPADAVLRAQRKRRADAAKILFEQDELREE